ncbi:MAG: hypothetical protein ABSH10_08845 [Phycisphaerae bacterium]|jgi:hypothetical protein
MKAQRRHELQENVLSAELGRGVEFFRQWRTYIVWGAVLVLLAVLVVWYSASKNLRARRELQATYDRLVLLPNVPPQEFLDGMKTLADSDDKHIAVLASMQVGRYCLAQFVTGGGMVADPRQKALADQAAAYFRRVLQRYPDQRLAVAEAHLGLGRVAESEGDFATATEEYQAVTAMTDLGGTPAATDARIALAHLDQIKSPVRMATTSSAPAATKPAH